MNRTSRRSTILGLLFVVLLAALPAGSAAAQSNPPPVEVTLPCADNVSVQVLGKFPVDDGSQSVALVRIIWGPGGGIEAHTHPGVMWVTVESGSFGLTLLDDSEMTVTRAATADREASEEPLTPGEEVALEAGDGFAETGMVHSARNLSDEPTTTVFAGLVTSDQPLTSCVDDASPVSGDTGIQG